MISIAEDPHGKGIVSRKTLQQFPKICMSLEPKTIACFLIINFFKIFSAKDLSLGPAIIIF